MLAATWFVAYSAVLPLTQAEWGLSSREAGMVQAAFHLGYLTSLFIVGFIADHFGAKRAYITTGVAACLSPWAFVLFADGFWSAFWLHAFTGLCQGGTYTPALALINDNVERARRGRAMGFLIAGSSAGYAICLLTAGAVLHFTGWRDALAVVAALPVISWVSGHLRVESRRPTRSTRVPPANRCSRRCPRCGATARACSPSGATPSTTGSCSACGPGCRRSSPRRCCCTATRIRRRSRCSFAALTYVANIAGSIVGGTMADRWGRTQTILLWSCVSLALSFSIGWLIALPLVLLVALACLYNFAGIADSSTHSLVLAESVPPHYLGVAYAVRSVIGFGAGVVSPVVFGWALDCLGQALVGYGPG